MLLDLTAEESEGSKTRAARTLDENDEPELRCTEVAFVMPCGAVLNRGLALPLKRGLVPDCWAVGNDWELLESPCKLKRKLALEELLLMAERGETRCGRTEILIPEQGGVTDITALPMLAVQMLALPELPICLPEFTGSDITRVMGTEATAVRGLINVEDETDLTGKCF